ncbi:hypothetical protein JOM56_001567 [Amanita muscaria]
MDSIVQFTVNDTSPTVSYSSDNWTPCFTDIGCLWINQSQAATPTGASYHLTSTAGASFTLKWRGTGVLLKGTATRHANYSVWLDNSLVKHPNPSQNILASIQNATLQDHNVTLVVNNGTWDDDFNVSYTGAVIYVDDTAAGSTVTLNETEIKYNGSWSDSDQFRLSNATGDVASTSVQGLSFFLYGKTSPSSGLYSVSLAASNNNTINSRFNANYSSTTLPANTSYLNSDALLFYASDLDPTLSYNVTVTNQGGGDLFIRSDGFRVFQYKSPPATTSVASNSPTSKTSTSTIAAIVLGVFLFVLFAVLLLFYFFVYRPRNRRCREEFDALNADKAEAEEERDMNTVMQLEEARISQSSSYRRRLARIISMIAPTEMSKRPSWRTDSQHLQPLSPLSPASTHKSDLILNISRRPSEKRDDRCVADPSTEEDGTLFVHVPASTLESDPQRPPNPRDEGSSVILHHRLKSSPDATIPVSPSISSGGGTQSRGRGSQNSSQPRSGRFSFPFSLSIPYVRTRSLTEDGNGNGRRSRMDHRRIESGRGGQGGDDTTSMSTIVFAEVPKVPPPPDKVKETTWDIRKSVKSFMSGLSGAGKRWYNARASAKAGEVIYPFVAVSSTTPTQRRALSAGGGLLIIGRDRRGSVGGATDDVESPRTDSRREENEPPTGTDITPLSYATESDDDFPSGEVEPQGSVDAYTEPSPAPPPPPPQQQEPFSSHPYAAAGLLSDPEVPSRMNVVGLQNASSEGSRQRPQRPQTAPAPSKVGFRQLPVIPRAPPVAHSVPLRARPHTAGGPVNGHMTSHDTITTGGRAIRALPPLPVPSAPKPTVQIASSSAEQAQTAQKSPLTPQSAVQDDTSSLPPPYPQSGHSKSSQRASDSTRSTHSSLRPPFLNVRELSPFEVNFPCTDDEQSQDEDKTKPSGSPSTARTRPTLEIPSTDALHHSAAAITPRTARSTAQYSFLDFATNSSSSNKEGSSREKSEPSPISDAGPSRLSDIPPLPILPMRFLDEPSRVEDKEEDLDHHSRRTFGQKRRSSAGSFYYNPADNVSLASPSTSSFTHQSHHTHQSYQTGPSHEGQRLSSQSSQRRQHASWRATFGGRIEGDIPEEATPSDSSFPFSLPARGSPADPQPATASASQSPPSRSSPPGLLPEPSDQIPHDVSQGEARRSYMSTSSAGHSAHVHPFSVGSNDLSQYAPQVQIEPISLESTDDVSVSSPIQFRAGGIRRTSSGDVQPVSHRRPTHTRDGGSSSSGSGDLRHPFSIP